MKLPKLTILIDLGLGLMQGVAVEVCGGNILVKEQPDLLRRGVFTCKLDTTVRTKTSSGPYT